MIISPQSLDTNLSQLLAEVKSGSMQLPEFQRDWTWDDNRIRGIIASLSQGYPMGAIMRLQYGNPDIQFKYRTITGVKGVSVKPEHLILDGQQRLTSIYQATSSKEPVSTKTEKGKAIKRYYYLSMERCLDDDEDRFDAVLSIPEDRKIKENFDRDVKLDLSTREYEYEKKLFPVNIVFDSNAVMDWFMGYMTHYGMKPEAMDEFKRFQADVLNTISGYKLPVITLDKSTPREAVCKVFENVNTGGVPLTVFELVTATYATRDFDLRKDWVQCRNTICGFGDTLRTDLFDGIDETTFLTTVCLYTSYLNKQSGKTNTISCKKKDVLGLPYESYIANRDAVLSGFKIAKEFLLRDQCVFRQRDLPYTTQLIPLAAICAVLGKSKCNEPNTIKTLSRWYWCGILGEMYGGSNETRYAYDIEDILAKYPESQVANDMQRPVVQTFEETPTCCRIRLEKAGLVNAALRCGVKPFSTLTALLCKAVRAYLDKDEVLYSYSTDARDALGAPNALYNCVASFQRKLPLTADAPLAEVAVGVDADLKENLSAERKLFRIAEQMGWVYRVYQQKASLSIKKRIFQMGEYISGFPADFWVSYLGDPFAPSSPELTRYIEDFQTWVPADGASIGLECTSLHGIITICVKNKVPRPGFAEALRAAFEAEGIKVLEAAELGADNT